MITCLGIDASNLRSGGGVTHLTQLLGAADPQLVGIDRIRVWGGKRTLSSLPAKAWLDAQHVPALDRALPHRIVWQQAALPRAMERGGCAVLLSPGGTIPIAGAFPKIAICQNLLPFERKEAARFGLSRMRLKLHLVGRTQTASFRRAEGVVFLTEYARAAVLARVGSIRGRTALIPHGVEQRFFCESHGARPPYACSRERPFRILYVSIVDMYKHQWNVARAVGILRRKGFPVSLELVGPAYEPALRRLLSALREVDPAGEFATYVGPVEFKALHARYSSADLFVFASSCENLPNILLEAMAAGLPIVSAERGPMPEVLRQFGSYCDPERPESIASAIERLYLDPEMRSRLGSSAQERAREFTWARCAQETLAFCSSFMERALARPHGTNGTSRTRQ